MPKFYAGTKCLVFTGPDNEPDGTAPYLLVQSSCSDSAASTVTIVSELANGANVVSFTLFDAESTDLTATLDGGTSA